MSLGKGAWILFWIILGIMVARKGIKCANLHPTSTQFLISNPKETTNVRTILGKMNRVDLMAVKGAFEKITLS